MSRSSLKIIEILDGWDLGNFRSYYVQWEDSHSPRFSLCGCSMAYFVLMLISGFTRFSGGVVPLSPVEHQVGFEPETFWFVVKETYVGWKVLLEVLIFALGIGKLELSEFLIYQSQCDDKKFIFIYTDLRFKAKKVVMRISFISSFSFFLILHARKAITRKKFLSPDTNYVTMYAINSVQISCWVASLPSQMVVAIVHSKIFTGTKYFIL